MKRISLLPESLSFKPRNRRSRGIGGGGGSSTLMAYAGGGTIANPTEWADWLINRPAPVANPNTQRYDLSRYWYGSEGHEKLRLEMAERWGHCLDISGKSSGISASVANDIADARTANPQTANGRLIKLALANPTRYKVGAWLGQRYPDATDAPSGYMSRVDGSLIGAWSPIADAVSMKLAVDRSVEGLKLIKEAGMLTSIVYHGSESGLTPLYEDPPRYFTEDPTVVAAKGSRSWYDFISERKGVQTKQFRDRVNELAPERQVYVLYVANDAPYENYIAGNQLYQWDYQYIKDSTDLPSNSDYYLELCQDLGDPATKNNPKPLPYPGYYDMATNTTSPIVSQIIRYNQPLSYNFVCPMGWYINGTTTVPAVDPTRIAPPLKATAYMKLACMAGSVGFVDGYFGPECVPELTSVYTPFDNNNPPPWMVQVVKIATEHTRFGYLDEFIFGGDLLPGTFQHYAKPQFPAYEFRGYKRMGNFSVADLGTRVWVRKQQNTDRYLVFVWAVAGKDRNCQVRDIPGVAPFDTFARIKGSLYIVDNSSGTPVAEWIDPPSPHPLDVPVLLGSSVSGSSAVLRFYAVQSLDESSLPPINSFTVAGANITSVEVGNLTVLHDFVRLNLDAPVGPGVSISYNGTGLRDSEHNVVPAFTSIAS